MEGEKWCNICSKMVHPMTEAVNKCPFCDTQFVGAIGNLSDLSQPIHMRSASVFSLYAYQLPTQTRCVRHQTRTFSTRSVVGASEFYAPIFVVFLVWFLL